VSCPLTSLLRAHLLMRSFRKKIASICAYANVRVSEQERSTCTSASAGVHESLAASRMSATVWAPSAALAPAKGAQDVSPPGLRRVEACYALAQAGRGLRAGCEQRWRGGVSSKRVAASAALFNPSRLSVG